MQIDVNDYANDARRAERGVWGGGGVIAYLSAIAQVGWTRSLPPAAVFQANHTFRLKGFSPDKALEIPSREQNQGRPLPHPPPRPHTLSRFYTVYPWSGGGGQWE